MYGNRVDLEKYYNIKYSNNCKMGIYLKNRHRYSRVWAPKFHKFWESQIALSRRHEGIADRLAGTAKKEAMFSISPWPQRRACGTLSRHSSGSSGSSKETSFQFMSFETDLAASSHASNTPEMSCPALSGKMHSVYTFSRERALDVNDLHSHYE